MLPFYVICHILYTFLISFFLSLHLPIRYALSRFHEIAASSHDAGISLYQGTVWHERRHPVHHSFRFSIRYALIDLDQSSYVPPNHLSANEARSIAKTSGPVLLLAIPPSVGYQRSPVTLYYCYDLDASNSRNLKKCIAELSNTPWGEKVQFLFNPNSDLVAKSLHISPFMDMLGDWHIKTRSPGNNLSVTVSVQHPELGNYFTASLTAKKVSSTSKVDHTLFFWLMPHKAAIYTYWQSLKLLLKNVPFFEHPKYKNPAYIEEVFVAAERRGCCVAFAADSQNHQQIQGRERWHAWTKAKWPWG